MKKRKLCYTCPLVLSCESYCAESATEELIDTKSNYSKEKYTCKPTSVTGYKIMAGQYD